MGDIYHAGSTYAGSVPIDDTQATATNTWSAQKINNEINELSDTSNAILNDVGAKNLLPNNAKTQVVNGVTFTVNSDGSVTCSGTATAITTFTLSYNTYKAGRYIVSKFADDSFVDESEGTFNYIAYMYNVDMPTIVISNEDKEFELSSDVENIQYALEIASGVTINKTVYPMIRPASVVDDTYVPYAMTNRELTQSTSKLTQSAVRVVIYDPITVNCAVGNNYANIPNLDVVNIFGVIVTGVTAGYSYETINNIAFVPSNNKLAISVTRAQNVTVKCASLHLF